VNISRVTPESLDQVWAAVRPQILAALRRGAGQHMTEDYYYRQVSAELMVMWVGHEGDEVIAAGILSVQHYPKHSALFVELLAGKNLDSWIEQVEPLLKEFKHKVGATTIEALCRPGLSKKLTRWKPKAILMEL